MTDEQAKAEAEEKRERIADARMRSLRGGFRRDRSQRVKLTVGRSQHPIELAIDKFILSKTPLVMPTPSEQGGDAASDGPCLTSPEAWRDECVLRMHLRGMSHRQMAEGLNVSTKTVGRIIRQLRYAPKGETPLQILEAVGRMICTVEHVTAQLLRLADRPSTPAIVKVRALTNAALIYIDMVRVLEKIGVIRKEDFENSPRKRDVQEIIEALLRDEDADALEPDDLDDDEDMDFAPGCRAAE